MSGNHRILVGSRLRLIPFGPADVSPRYLSWLSDPVVNEWSRRRDTPAVMAGEARAYLGNLNHEEVVLGIHVASHGHIGNVKYGPVDRPNSRADISIVIGERAAWNQGFGGEAIYLVTRYLFEELGLNRVDAGSANPAFLQIVARLGWVVEGVQRQRLKLGGRFHDLTLVAQLRESFVRRPQHECKVTAGWLE